MTHFQRKARFTPPNSQKTDLQRRDPKVPNEAPSLGRPRCQFYDIFTLPSSPTGPKWGSYKTLAKHNHLPREKPTWGPSVYYRALLVLPLCSCLYPEQPTSLPVLGHLAGFSLSYYRKPFYFEAFWKKTPRRLMPFPWPNCCPSFTTCSHIESVNQYTDSIC